MKYILILLVLAVNFTIASNYQAQYEKRYCDNLKVKFEQSDYLLEKFDDPIGAIEIVRVGTGIDRQLLSGKKPKCVDGYFEKWVYLVLRAGSLYEMEEFEKKYGKNAKLHLYLGDKYAKRKDNVNAVKQYKKYSELKKTNIEKRVSEYIEKSGYEHYKSKWAPHLKPEKIVEGVYNNVYFSTKTKKILATDTTKSISYIAGNDKRLKEYLYKPISSYHIKVFKLEKPKTFMLSLKLPLSTQVRLIIDDRLVLDRSKDLNLIRKIQYSFKAGMHKIEIENLCKSPLMMIHFKMIEE